MNTIEAFWRNGEECRYTGATTQAHGTIWYVFVWLTGPKTGREGVTMYAPGSGGPGKRPQRL